MVAGPGSVSRTHGGALCAVWSQCGLCGVWSQSKALCLLTCSCSMLLDSVLSSSPLPSSSQRQTFHFPNMFLSRIEISSKLSIPCTRKYAPPIADCAHGAIVEGHRSTLPPRPVWNMHALCTHTVHANSVHRDSVHIVCMPVSSGEQVVSGSLAQLLLTIRGRAVPCRLAHMKTCAVQVFVCELLHTIVPN